jgi:autotransporter-associated beta strand protein
MHLLPVLLALTMSLSSLMAAEFVLTGTDAPGSTSFNAAGHWSSGLAPSPGNTYRTGAFALRSVPTGSATFAGDSLSIDSGGVFGLKSAGPHTIADLILNGGTLSHWGLNSMVAEVATVAGNITLAQDSFFSVGGGTGSNTRSIIVTASIGGAAGFTLDKAGTLTGDALTLNSANSYQGLTTVNGGTLVVRQSASLGSTAQGTVVNGSLGNTGSILRLNALSGSINLQEPLSFVANANGRVNLFSETAGNVMHSALTLSGSGNAIGIFANNGTFTLNGGVTGAFNNSLQLRGTAVGVLTGDLNIPAASINKTDISTWVLGDATPSTYAWTTLTVAVGTLQMGAASVLPAGSPVILGQNDAQNPVLDLNGFPQTVSGVSVNASGTGGTKRVTNLGTTPAVLTVQPAGTSTFAGTAAVTAAMNDGPTATLGLTKAGAGTFALQGAGITYSGPTTVQAGTLALQNTSGFNSDVDNQSTLRLVASTPWSFVRQISGSGAVVKTGADVLTLVGPQFHTGPTVIEQGTLALSAVTDNSLASSPLVDIRAGATLDVSGLASMVLQLSPGQTLSGEGSVVGGLIVDLDSVLSPGASPGSLTTQDQHWREGGELAFELSLVDTAQVSQDALAGVSSGHDTLHVQGLLSLGASSAEPFRIRLHSLQADLAPGAVPNWDPSRDYTWTLATTANGVTGFAPEEFSLHTADFSAHNLVSGVFSVTADSQRLYLNYTAVPEPHSALLFLLGLALARLGRTVRPG